MMARTTLKAWLVRASKLLPLGSMPFDGMLRLSQGLSSAVARGLFVRDWRMEVRGRPRFFKHKIDLSRWPSDPSRWSFTARGVYAREEMFEGCKVLDLCCGDGSYSFLFFSDIAGAIDAVDYDANALAYARRQFAAPRIAYHQIDIVREPLPSAGYDFVVWNAAICYFREEEIRLIIEKIIAAGKAGMVLRGMLPRANGWVDHKTEFEDSASIERFLQRYFEIVAIRQVNEGSAVSFYFRASAPRHDAGRNAHEVRA
jgi:SAM-dependent methyltransferase